MLTPTPSPNQDGKAPLEATPDDECRLLLGGAARELAQQLVGAVRGLAVGLDGTRVVAVTGGAISRQQRDAIAVCYTRL